MSFIKVSDKYFLICFATTAVSGGNKIKSRGEIDDTEMQCISLPILGPWKLLLYQKFEEKIIHSYVVKRNEARAKTVQGKMRGKGRSWRWSRWSVFKRGFNIKASIFPILICRAFEELCVYFPLLYPSLFFRLRMLGWCWGGGGWGGREGEEGREREGEEVEGEG